MILILYEQMHVLFVCMYICMYICMYHNLYYGNKLRNELIAQNFHSSRLHVNDTVNEFICIT